MGLFERELEEDEAKIDNLLHKILKSIEQVDGLVQTIRSDVDDGKVLERLRMIDILTETMKNLTVLADEIDQHDEEITADLQTKVTSKLNDAVTNIKEASRFV